MQKALQIREARDKQECARAEEEQQSRSENAGGLLLVGLYKLGKAIFFALVGLGALHLIHQDLGDLVMRMIAALRIPEGTFVNLLLDKADDINNHQLRQAGMFAFGYSGLCLVEGTGLMLQKVWAEYLTVVLTTAGLPYEIYELIKSVAVFKIVALVINLVVLLYLLWVLKKKRDKRKAPAYA